VRCEPRFFTRSRDLPFPLLISFLLNGVRGAVQSELDAFFALLDGRTRLCRVVSAAAFAKARSHLLGTVFERLNAELLRLIETLVGLPRWQGLRVLAGDGSKLRLTLTDRAGCRSVREVLAFGLFLPGIELFESLVLDPVGNERQVLFEQLDRLDRRDLLVLDRGFPAAWLVSVLLARGIAFCMRCDSASGFAAVRRFLRSGRTEAIVTLPAPKRTDAADYECPRRPSTVRLIRDVTPQGTVRVLMTSLTDQSLYPAARFAQLYHGRWRIEEAFKRIKHRLNLEHTSGMNWRAAQQDAGAKMVCDNLNALAAYLAAEQHLPEDSPWRINRTLAFNTLRRILPRALGLRILAPRVVAEVLAEIARNLQKFVSHRRRPRPPGPKPHKYPAYKPGV
jgi:hypothetical protein